MLRSNIGIVRHISIGRILSNVNSVLVVSQWGGGQLLYKVGLKMRAKYNIGATYFAEEIDR